MIFKAQLNGDSHCALEPLPKRTRTQRLPETAVRQVWLSEVRQQLGPDSRSSCNEDSCRQSLSGSSITAIVVQLSGVGVLGAAEYEMFLEKSTD